MARDVGDDDTQSSVPRFGENNRSRDAVNSEIRTVTDVGENKIEELQQCAHENCVKFGRIENAARMMVTVDMVPFNPKSVEPETNSFHDVPLVSRRSNTQ